VPGGVLRGVRDASDRASGAVDRHDIHRSDPQVPRADHEREAQAFVALLLSQVSGCPMVVIPVGIDANGVPFGIQLIPRRWHDE
jgi:Asp-tRNA(Asn)/Glu-tRNA(Gln) amidotransferase A subunit family amidase